MSQFSELKGLSALTKLLALVLVVVGVVAGFAMGGGEGFTLAAVSVVGALAYWIQARFIDILLQINSNTMDTLADVRSMVSANRLGTSGATGRGTGAPSTAARRFGMSWVVESVPADSASFDVVVTEERGGMDSSIPVLVSGVPAGTSVRISWQYPNGRKTAVASNDADTAGSCLTEVDAPSDAQVGAYQLVVSTSLGSVSIPVAIVFAR